MDVGKKILLWSYLAKDKCIEDKGVRNFVSVLSTFIMQLENPFAIKIEDEKNCYLVKSLQQIHIEMKKIWFNRFLFACVQKYRWVTQLETWINRFLHMIFVTRGSLQKWNKKCMMMVFPTKYITVYKENLSIICRMVYRTFCQQDVSSLGYLLVVQLLMQGLPVCPW